MITKKMSASKALGFFIVLVLSGIGQVLYTEVCLASPASPSSALKKNKIVSPVEDLNDTAEKILEAFRKNQKKLAKNPSLANEIINQWLLPKVDLPVIAERVLGTAWQKAKPAQRNRFLKACSTMLTNTYASALMAYDHEEIKFYPIRGDYQHKKELMVKSQVISSEGASIAVDYLVHREAREWKVVDVLVDNVSLVAGFRSQFAEALKTGGIDQLTQAIEKHNKALAAS